jgi:hypothetical protein
MTDSTPEQKLQVAEDALADLKKALTCDEELFRELDSRHQERTVWASATSADTLLSWGDLRVFAQAKIDAMRAVIVDGEAELEHLRALMAAQGKR